ncbi:MAG: alpha/beta hydrolase [Planctomycetota bacterium]
MKFLAIATLLALPLFAADQPKQEPLWADGAPLAKGTSPADTPGISIFLAPEGKANGAAVVICPGGGYGGLMMSYEGRDIAKWLNEQGIAGIVLQYRVKPYQHPAPWLDVKRAMRTVRARAGELKLDPNRIGVIGFSAGGHVASTIGTHFDAGDANAKDAVERLSCRPDFMILVYPVISMGPKGHGGSRTNLLGKSPTQEEMDFVSNELHVTDKTPPTFLVHAKTDKVVNVEHSVMFYEALKAHNVPAEFLELPTGEHGLGVGKGPLWAEWQAKCSEWLKATVGKK